MLDLILNPFVTVLTWLYSVLNHDVVLAIVVLTVIIRFLTYPLLARQQESSRKMQQLQPKLKKLQEKYKNDREKLSEVQMKLYKEHGVNPVGGCLPLVVQFPILIGLYQSIAFALAATPFQLVDLSERLLIPGLDPLIPLQRMWLGMDLTLPPTTNPQYALILPLLVLITTWAQSKMTMNMNSSGKSDTDDKDEDSGSGGQAQAMTKSMTTIMPLMFGFFSLSFSVGLSIYFVTSNVMGIIQYSPQGKKVLNRIFGHKKADDDDVIVDGDDEDDEPVKQPRKAQKKKKPRKK
jgi:YidC/Oxa1 family membrane protein insertase